MVTNDEIKNQLLESFPDAQIEVDNPRGDDVHFKIEISSSQFVGLSRINQHKLVYKALGNKFNKCGQSLHAIELRTKAREE
ncbi:MAG: BolA/IbaG family iron-sulfur metabolism protein [Nanoarchaeota archaeon]|nr:BolA/IbaG family iron-sulfur metabolism protein [Nanoarchaeota archaeon]